MGMTALPSTEISGLCVELDLPQPSVSLNFKTMGVRFAQLLEFRQDFFFAFLGLNSFSIWLRSSHTFLQVGDVLVNDGRPKFRVSR